MRIIDLKKPLTGEILKTTPSGAYVVIWTNGMREYIKVSQQKEKLSCGRLRYKVIDDIQKD